MTRVPINDTKTIAVISREDYEADRRRGYTVLEYSPEGELVVKNPRNPAKSFRKVVPAVHMFRCMLCQYDVVDNAYSDDPETGAKRTGIDLITKHVAGNKHSWRYGAFTNPYGNIEDVTIEGVEDYSKEISQ